MRADPNANTRGLPTLPALASSALRARNDPRDVTTDPHASYFGIMPGERTLLPGDGAHIAETRFVDWLSCSTAQQPPAPSVSVRGA